MPNDGPQIRLAGLPRNVPTPVRFEPSEAESQETATLLELSKLRKARLEATLHPEGKRDWRLEGTLGATVTQPCVLTQEPVTTRLDVPVLRRYLAEAPEPTAEDEEMPEDDSIEPLPALLDLEVIFSEALALAIPLYPKAADATLTQTVFAGPGIEPMTDEDAKPLAGLAALKAKLEQSNDGGDTEL